MLKAKVDAGLDFDDAVAGGLAQGKAPILEPGLNELLAGGLADHRGELALRVELAHDVAATHELPADEELRRAPDREALRPLYVRWGFKGLLAQLGQAAQQKDLF